jgi:hypothetical protein
MRIEELRVCLPRLEAGSKYALSVALGTEKEMYP